MFKNLKKEQEKSNLTNKQIADKLGISVNAYMWKKRTSKFFYHEICILLELFDCSFEYLFDES